MNNEKKEKNKYKRGKETMKFWSVQLKDGTYDIKNNLGIELYRKKAGPFQKLIDAKNHVDVWIGNDRFKLRNNKKKIDRLRVSSFKKLSILLFSLFSLFSCGEVNQEYLKAEYIAIDIVEGFKDDGYLVGLTSLEEYEMSLYLRDRIYDHCQNFNLK